MTPFTHLQFEQDGLLEDLARYCRDPDTADAMGLVEAIARSATVLSQVRTELLLPHCVGRVPSALIDATVVDMDLVRVLVLELVHTQASCFMLPGLVAGLHRLLIGRFAGEEGAQGLWAEAIRGGLDADALDVAVGQRLNQLEREARISIWRPLSPECLETLRDSVPPGAVRFDDLS